MAMDSDRWRRAQELFHEAVELPASDRAAFLDRMCSDPTLVAEVLEMAAADDDDDSVLSRGIAAAAQRLLDAPTLGLPPDVGPYRLTNLVGEGGMGTVFRAERTDIKSVVAIKILRDARLSPARRHRFAKEQQLLAQLRHPSIAQLHDAGAFPDGTPFFVMEFVEGVAITDYCREHASPIAERLRLFRDVCAAVQHAHRQLVIHRDLKPSNIFVTRDGQVKLLDFGISKRLDEAYRGQDETRTGFRLLTPGYAAPEQLLDGQAAVDTDVYSLGVVLYELLAGARPFDLADRTPAEVRAILLEQEPQKPSLVSRRASVDGKGQWPTVSRGGWADLDVLALTAMHRDRTRRYPTVEALMRDIDHYFQGQPLEARPDDLRYRTAKFVGRNRRPLAGAALAVGTLAALITFYTVRLKTARDAAVAEVERTRRVERFTLSLFEGGDKDVGSKKGLLAATLVDRGLQEAQSLNKDPEIKADLYATLGAIYEKLGNLPQADTLLRSALEQRRALFGADAPLVGKSLLDLGLLRDDQAKYDEAERLVREGLQNAKSRRPASPTDIAEATHALGKVLEDRGLYPQAIPVLEEAVRLRTAVAPDSPELAASVTELANTHFYAGHLDLCQTLNERALTLDRKLHGDRHPTVSSDLFNLGIIKSEKGDYVGAEQLYRQGLEITRAWYGDDHPQTAADLVVLARAVKAQDHYGEAMPMLQQALAIRERQYGKDHPSIASILNEIGSVEIFQEKFDDAERTYLRVLDIYRVAYGVGEHALVGIGLANLGSVYLAHKDYPRAEATFRKALVVYAKKVRPDHINAGIAHMKLGRAILRQGNRYAEAQTESLAGYEILKKQVNPNLGFLQKAREDLAAEYQALKQPEQARRFRDELASVK